MHRIEARYITKRGFIVVPALENCDACSLPAYLITGLT